MIIASEIKQRLPHDSARLEHRVRFFSDYHDSHVYVAQAEYQALMDTPSVKDGKMLDNGRARVFNFEFGSQPSTVRSGPTWVFADEGPGREAYDAIVGEHPRILPYFREDIHHTYITLKQLVKTAANKLVGKMLKTFYGGDYRGIYLFASMFSERKPHYVPSFTFRQKSGHWDYAADYSVDDKLIPPPAQIIHNPFSFDDEISGIINAELTASHKSSRFMQWVMGVQPPPNEVGLGTYDIVYVGNPINETEEDAISVVPTLTKVGGLVVTDSTHLSDLLLHGHRNLRPFFTAEPYISQEQFLIKTK